MIRLIKQIGTNQCSSCLRATFDGAEGEKLDHVYELDVGYKNHYISVRLCDECVRQLIAECVITLTKIAAIMAWEAPDESGNYIASSCYLGDDWPICHDCLVDHCTHANCLGCNYGKYPDCRFLEMKTHYTTKED